MTYGNPCCSNAPLAKYSQASFWKPYVDCGGGQVLRSDSELGKLVADSYTMEELITTIFSKTPL